MNKSNLIVFFFILMSSTVKAQERKTAPVPASTWPRCVHYEIFVRSFYDANADGIGDLKGITAKWDYLHGLGVEGIWLTPIFPSPSYHKYDVTDYYNIDKEYGNIEWFDSFIRDAHKQGFKIIIDLPLNHCSNKHPWFIDASKNPQSPYRDFFIWSDNPSDDKEHWHQLKDEKGKPVAGKYYYGFFSDEMPDLNYNNPDVVNEAIKIASFWLTEKKIDGFRLDAAQHIFDEQNKTIAFWEKFKAACMQINPEVFLVGEVGNSYDAIAPYLKSSFNSCFNFDLSSALLTMIKKENVSGFNNMVEKTQALYASANRNYVDATFITNHDQNRIMSEVKGSTDKAVLAAAILFTLPGAPFIYYGEEIGMLGEKPDEHIREPMLFDSDKKDTMRTKWVKPIYSTDATVFPADAQKFEFTSLLNRYQQLIILRKGVAALGHGKFEPVTINSKEVFAFFRTYNKQRCLIFHNVSAKNVTLIMGDAEKTYTQSLYQTSKTILIADGKITLPPYSSIILREPIKK